MAKQNTETNLINRNKNLEAQVEELGRRLNQAMQERAMISPPEIVSALTVHRTIGEDMVFGRCNHALQMLPNQTVLLLVTPDETSPSASTFLIGEECTGFTVEKTMIETPDDTA